MTCEELKKLTDSGATQDIVVVGTQPRAYFDEAHCPCEHEEESTEMAAKLQKLGYTKLKLLQGGLPRWRELNYPMVKTGNGLAEKR